MLEDYEVIINILVGIASSFIASIVFWFLTFRFSQTDIRFSDCIEMSPDVYNKSKMRYRIKLINIGRRDLYEVTYTVRLTIKRQKITNNTYLALGYPYMRPVLHGRKWQNKNKPKVAAWTLALKMTDSTYEEFCKDFYPKSIKKAARNKSLSVGDIFKVFGNTIGITIYACGYDSVTGARKMFISKTYSVSDVRAGKFNGASHRKKYKDYVDHLLTIPKSSSNQKTSISDVAAPQTGD